jgi:uncharacterized radical SAM superfamily protein
MNIPDTLCWQTVSPSPEAIADIIAEARLSLPHTVISLGCARQRGNYEIETLAIKAGVNRMAIPSEEAVLCAKQFGLKMYFQRTCCSVSKEWHDTHWKELVI